MSDDKYKIMLSGYIDDEAAKGLADHGFDHTGIEQSLFSQSIDRKVIP